MANRIVEARERQTRALELRLKGHEYEEIAEMVGYSDKAAAYNGIRAVLDRREAEGVDQMRTIEGARLDKVQSVLWPLVEQGDLAAIDRLLKVMQRRANLYGLDLAGRVDIVAGGEVDLDGTVARIIAIAKGQQPTLEGHDNGI